MDTPAVLVGIDVANAHLDVAERPPGSPLRVPNSAAGIAPLVARWQSAPPTRIVLEATGGLEAPLAAAVATAGGPVVVVNPRQVRHFAQAVGQFAKPDALDATLLARFAEAVRPPPRPLPDAHAQALTALLTRRSQIMTMLVAEQQRLHTARPTVQPRVQTHVAWLQTERAALDQELAATIQQSPRWRERDERLRRVPGVAPLLATTLVAERPNWAAAIAQRSRLWPGSHRSTAIAGGTGAAA